MKTNDNKAYIFGGILLFIGVLRLSNYYHPNNVSVGISLILISLVIMPSFNYICKLFNKNFSKERRIFLGIGTFLIMVILNNAIYNSIAIYIVMVSIFWIIMFTTNKEKNVDNEMIMPKEKENKNDNSNKNYNFAITNRNSKALAAINYENEIKNDFYNLDMMSLNAVARMVSETKEKNESRFNQNIPEIYISKLLMSFCKDTQRFNKEVEFNNLYTKEYYINKININCSPLTAYIKSEIKKSLPSDQKWQYKNVYNEYINVLVNSIDGLAEEKLKNAFSKDYYLYLDDYLYDRPGKQLYEYSFDYLIDLLATCTCITKILFIDRKVKQLDDNSEFYKIVSNMNKTIKIKNLIVEKSRPIYDEFYTSELGFIYDDLLYNVAIMMILNKNSNKDLPEEDKKIVDIKGENINDFATLNQQILQWISSTTDKYRKTDISKYIVIKIVNSVDKSNFDLLLNTLGRLTKYVKLYNLKVEKIKKEEDKNRYLNDNFVKEKSEIYDAYSLFDINNGVEFEKYLLRLFNDLGYGVNHCGKSGDQGADLLLKKGTFIYAVQAKYYSGKLDNTPVQEVVGALKYYDAHQGVVVTNSEFTSSAKELAKVNHVILIDKKGLKKLIDYTFDEDLDEDVLKNFEK